MREVNVDKSARTAWAYSFLIALFLYLLGACFESTLFGHMEIPNRVNDIFKLLSMAILAVSAVIHIKQYRTEQWLCFGLFGALAIAEYLTCGSMAPILLLLFWINIRDAEADDIFRVFFAATLVVFVCTVVSCAIGLIPNWIFMEDCNCVGYSHSNAFGMAWMTIVVSYLAFRKENAGWVELAIGLAGTVVIYLLSKSDGSLVICILALVASAVFTHTHLEWLDRVTYIAGVIICPLMTCVIHLITMIYDPQNNIDQWINSKLTGRVALGQNGLANYGARLFGQKIDWTGGDYRYVDSSYLGVLIVYGIVFFILIIILHTLFGVYAGKRKLKNWSVAIILIGLHAFVEKTLVTIWINPVAIAIGFVFYHKYISYGSNTKYYSWTDMKAYLLKNKAWVVAAAIVATVVIVILGRGNTFYDSSFTESLVGLGLKEYVILGCTGIMTGAVLSIAALILVCIWKSSRKTTSS